MPIKELLVGLSAEGKREMTSFMGSVNAKTRDILQVRLTRESEKEQAISNNLQRVGARQTRVTNAVDVSTLPNSSRHLPTLTYVNCPGLKDWSIGSCCARHRFHASHLAAEHYIQSVCSYLACYMFVLYSTFLLSKSRRKLWV